jgi:aryl carrier-like protein
VDWVKWQQLYPDLGRWPLLADLARSQSHGPPSKLATQRGLTREQLMAFAPADRLSELRRYLCEQIAAVLARSESTLDTDEPLNNFGLDSIMALELKNRMETGLGLTIPMVHFLQGCSINQLASDLLDKVVSTPKVEPAPRAFTAAAGATGLSLVQTIISDRVPNERRDLERMREAVEQLSESEVDSLLSDLLADQEGKR